MLKRAISVLALLAVVSTGLVIPVAADETAMRYVVVFSGSGIPKKAGDLIAKSGGQLVRTLPEIGVAVAVSASPNFASSLRGARGVQAVGLERFQALPPLDVVEYVESGPTTADDLYSLYQWDIRRVMADQAWATTSGSHDTVVAVIDTGIASNHPDLAPNLVHAGCFSSGPTCSIYPDLHWHGTHVAGTVAAAFGGGRAVGVGPNLGLASYNVFEVIPGCGVCAYDEPIWSAMIDAANRGFDVINMSLGGYIVRSNGAEDVAAWTAWNRVADYVTRQGVTVVASAGNGNLDLNGPVDHIPSDVTGVISVGATGIRSAPAYPQPGAYDVRAFYSNFGAAVTLSAPGGDCGLADSCNPLTRPANWFQYLVLSDFVFASPVCAATASCPVSYAWAGGTSMAAPHVAGTAGLVKDLNPGLNPHQVTSILKRTAESLGSRQQFGHGMVDASAAIR